MFLVNDVKSTKKFINIIFQILWIGFLLIVTQPQILLEKKASLISLVELNLFNFCFYFYFQLSIPLYDPRECAIEPKPLAKMASAFLAFTFATEITIALTALTRQAVEVQRVTF